MLYCKIYTAVWYFFADPVISTLTPTVTELGEQSQQLGDQVLATGTAILNSYGANIPTAAPTSAPTEAPTSAPTAAPTPDVAAINQTQPTGDQL